jgi:O-antigen/teichoic acid export membrane protein
MTTLSTAPDRARFGPLAAEPVRPLKRLALYGSVWTIAGFGASQVLRLTSTLILTRFLFPEAFGITALTGIFLQGLEMFSDVGIGPSIIQNRRGDDPIFLNTAWTIQVIRGFLLWIVSALIAWPVARLYGAPQLMWLIPVAGLTAIIQGFNATVLLTRKRHLAVGGITLLELFVQAVTIVVIVTLALIRPSVWDITIGGLVGSFVKMTLSHVIFPAPWNRFQREPAACQELFRFGRWIFLSTLLTFFALQIDRLLLGKLVPLGELGIYTVAASLAQMPRGVIQRLVDVVVYPALSRLSCRTENYYVKVTFARCVLLLLSGQVCALLIVTAQPLVQVFYDGRYRATGPILSLLVVRTWLETMSVSYGTVLLAAGRPKYISLGVGLRTGLFLILVWPAFHQFGVVGVAGATAASELGVLVACLAGASRIGVLSIRHDLMQFLLAVTMVAVLFILREACVTTLGSHPAELGVLTAVIVISLPLTALGVLRWGRSSF